MPKRRWNSKALAERRRRAFQFYLAGFTQEEIAEKVGGDGSVVSRDPQSVRESVSPGEPPDVQEACFTQVEKLDRLEHSYWVGLGESEVEKSSAQLCTFPNMPTQANTILAHASTSPYMPAHSCATLEPPSQKHKSLCERYLHRWIRPSFPFRGGRQAGLGEYRQGIEVKRLPHRRELAAEIGASRKNQPRAGISTEHVSPRIFANTLRISQSVFLIRGVSYPLRESRILSRSERRLYLPARALDWRNQETYSRQEEAFQWIENTVRSERKNKGNDRPRGTNQSLRVYNTHCLARCQGRVG
jgi:hypothetical protein